MRTVASPRPHPSQRTDDGDGACLCHAAVFIANMYLSLPYLITEDTGIALGLAHGVLVVYMSFGRGYVPVGSHYYGHAHGAG